MNINPFELMKNAKDLQAHFGKMQEEIAALRVQGVSGGGLVKVTMSGTFDMIKIELDPIAVDNRDIQMLQDLIRSAHTDAVEKIKETLKEKVGPLAALAGGMLS
ncbi:YbaB/EbfC family nucleoid-associated protein [Treponema vincentii]|uniref:YbaB/EbfC family nucleoid-associated protein n=1 Tax=Treponema vincentii TaxID=69710 RepID=UPI0020A619FC|nr:YbaB/EbfC family nucleoid-associated protein [Treponema vincentii]UTC48405.1 YbaB/EbfC family nucleoid-associated protein [Treponema vincentii]